ncbi:hypothetical protein GCM10011322_42820 [Salinarimonas ramus]|uniref:Uncharacterized protein n=2 Tax=Salinarimonas ramus TaxID=690164 RepID=A0A917V8E5_9HYPH|nr:hypothetical protein GCM10011322_42820 [Salinarimonas ramus]
MLGDLLAAARRADGELAAWLAHNEPALAVRAEEAARAAGETLAGFARASFTAFERHAREEEWASMTSGLRRTDDPGLACLADIIAWRLAADETATTTTDQEARS